MSTDLQSVLADREYKNWSRAGLSLKYAREGILNLVKNGIDNFHQDLLYSLLAGSQCSNCSTENIVPCRNNNNFCKFSNRACTVHDNNDPNKSSNINCPNSVCDTIYTEIIKEHRYTPTWRNTDCHMWCTQPWQLAKCYMPEGYASKDTAAVTDFPGMLHVIINNRRFDNLVNDDMGNKSNIFCQARDVRNTILHNADLRITDTDLAIYIQTLQTMLSNPKCSTTDPDIQKAHKQLSEIQNGTLFVTTEDIDEIKAEACRAIEEKKQEALAAVNKSKEDACCETKKAIEGKKRKALSDLKTAVKKIRLEAEGSMKQTADDAKEALDDKQQDVLSAVISQEAVSVKAINKAGVESVTNVQIAIKQTADDVFSATTKAVEVINKATEKAKADVEVKQQHAEIAIKQTTDHVCCDTQKVLDDKQQDVLSAVTFQEAVSVKAVNTAGVETVKRAEMAIKQTADDVCSVTKKVLEDKKQDILSVVTSHGLSSVAAINKARAEAESAIQKQKPQEAGMTEDSVTRNRKDYYEPSLNNLDDTPPPTPPLPSSPLDTGTSNLSSILVHEQDEEKLSNIDCNLQTTEVKTQFEKKVTLDKNIPVEQAINDDDNCDESDDDDDDIAIASSSCSDNKNGDTDFLRLYPYQLELAEIAVKGLNTIVCAGTGSGKTFVALHIIKQHFEGDRGQRKVAFMAPTSALVKQQSDKCKRYLNDLKVKLVTGQDDNSKMLGMFLRNNDILCFTPQILVNNLANGGVKSVSDFTMLILDECHHTKGNEPYNLLMQEYLEHKTLNTIKLPQVLGLTATIGIGKSHTEIEAREYILRVMACLDVTRLSQVERNKTHYLDITKESVEEKIPMRIPGKDPCKAILLKAIDDTEDLLKDMALMQQNLRDLMVVKCPPTKESQEYQKWTKDVIKTAQQSVDNRNISRKVSACANYLSNYNAAFEVNSLLRPADIISFLAEKHKEDSEQEEKLTKVENKLLENLNQVLKDVLRCKDAENPNVRILSDTLKQMLTDKGDDSRAMVFVETRATCKSLAAFLSTDLVSIDVKTSPLYGKQNRASDDGMIDSVQNDVLEKFCRGFYKVVVTTSVALEGIDVPDCNIVLNYNYSGNEITKLQMKGRSRKPGATTIIMGSQKIMEEEETNAYKASMMQTAMKLVRRLSENEINKKVKHFQSEEIGKMRFRKQVEELKLQQKTEEDFLIQCLRCYTPVANLSDIRVIEGQHIVIDKSLENRIEIRPHKSPKEYGGFKKHSKMYCKKCPQDWGIIANKDGLICRILKISSMLFISRETDITQQFGKWGDVPGRLKNIKSEDLPRLLGQTAE